MKLWTIFVIAFGLAMDAFAVSIVTGGLYKDFKIRHALRMALFFGGFQALMPILGFLAGQGLERCVAAYDHWVAFALLCFVGSKMIYESFRIDAAGKDRNPANLSVLLILSFATSIDALAVGITLSLLKAPIALAVTIIGTVTFVLSYGGVLLGKRFGHLFESKAEIIGGLILIAIGVKIVIEHLTA
jgi:putative Mn2+ efflux pump MntP